MKSLCCLWKARVMIQSIINFFPTAWRVEKGDIMDKIGAASFAHQTSFSLHRLLHLTPTLREDRGRSSHYGARLSSELGLPQCALFLFTTATFLQLAFLTNEQHFLQDTKQTRCVVAVKIILQIKTLVFHAVTFNWLELKWTRVVEIKLSLLRIFFHKGLTSGYKTYHSNKSDKKSHKNISDNLYYGI